MGSALVITPDKLLQLNKFLPPAKAQDYATALEAARPIANLNTGRRVRHFMAQVADETNGFRALVESFFYTDPKRLDDMYGNIKSPEEAAQLIAQGQAAIANVAMANRLGNGDAASGDGYMFRGRGFIQITGRWNYKAASGWSGMDLITQPGLAGQAKSAAVIAAKYWNYKKINEAADAGDIAAVTELVNGTAEAGLADRKVWLMRMMKFFPDV